MSTNRMIGRERPVLLQSSVSNGGEPEYIVGTYDAREIRIVYIDQEAQKQREEKRDKEVVEGWGYLIVGVVFLLLCLFGIL